MNSSLRGSASRCASLLLGLLTLATLSAPPRAVADPTPVPLAASVDLQRFMGNWYVIAHIPPEADRDAHNGVESYRLVDGRVETTYRRRPGSFEAPEKIDTPVGYVKEGSGNALWGMRFWWWFPIRLEYRISYLEPDYSVTIIGRSKRDYVWLMSRTPAMSDGDYERYRALMASWGYDTSKLVRVPQQWPLAAASDGGTRVDPGQCGSSCQTTDCRYPRRLDPHPCETSRLSIPARSSTR